MRRVASAVLLVVAGVLFPLLVVANWAGTTVYDSDTFSDRAVEPLNSEAVRRELARRLTEQLAQAGNQQATAFRPAFELALEGVIDSDTFRSIFRNAIRRTHQAILAGEGGEQGLDLGASFAVITSGLQISGGGGGGTQQGKEGLTNSLSDVTKRLDELGIWDLKDTIGRVALVCLFGGLAAAAGSILLAEDRRRAVRRLGFTAVIGGIAIVALLLVGNWFVGRQIAEPRLADAITGALREVTGDLRLTGLWIAAYGVVLAAAAATSGRRYTPAEVWRRTRGWVERRRRTTRGTVLLAVLGLVISVAFIQNPLGNLELLVRAAALWVGYLALTEILRLVQTITAQTRERRSPWPRVAVIGGTLVVIVSLVTFAFVLTTRGAATAAERSGKQTCNGKKSLCDLRLDQVTFPGVHHAMASANYPGYLFAQQIGTVSQQLDSGVRALNFDTYYGVPSTARIPGQDVPIILTDKVAAAAGRAEVNEDPVAAKRAAQLAARAPKAADAQRGIYMCHSNCETGAVAFAKPLSEIKSFLNSHPDDVLIVSFHDNTTPADTAAAIEAAGLSDRAATLQPGQPLPTLRQLIDSGRTMLVFSERGGPGGPPWYHNMYDWFQETTFSFNSEKDFNCLPNRGPATAPLFLINHWLTLSPPDPVAEGAVNSRAVLEKRVQQCLTQRGLAPNIIAVNFGERGDLISTVRSINEARLKEVRAKRNAQRIPTEPPPEGTTTPASPEAGPAARLPEPTVITTLTGGDPARFCRVLPSVSLGLSSWAAAILTADPADTGLSDLAYAPLLARDLQEYIKAAPQELGPRAAPILDRARNAVSTLRALGLSDRDVKRLADAASDALLSPKSPDGVEAQAVLVKLLEKKVDAQRLRQAAADFRAGQPDPATLLDLGSVSPEIGVAAGYGCAAEVSKV